MTETATETRRIPPFIRQLVDLRDRQVQKARIQFELRLSAIERGADRAGKLQRAVVTRYLERLSRLEEEIDEDIARVVQRYPIYEHLIKIKGIGPMLAAKLIALIDIRRAPTVSSLWRFAGYAVIDGQRERAVAGQKLRYCKRLKTTVYLIATSFLRSRSPYRAIYDRARVYYEANRPDWTKAHVHQAAMRKMAKIFLAHLWTRWRELEGLPVGVPWIIGQIAEDGHVHTHLITPEEMGWRAVGNEEPIGPVRTEEPVVQVRAGEREEPIGKERVAPSETPDEAERAEPRETPEQYVRAEAHERPSVRERAIVLETPDTCVRVSPWTGGDEC